MSDPFETLGLSPQASPEEVKTAWRKLAAVHHPDRGGDTTEFQRYRYAYQLALAIAEAPTPCETCRGTGKVPAVRGNFSIAMPCRACGGAGEIKR